MIYGDDRAVVLASADGQVQRRIPVPVDIGAIAYSPASGRLVIQGKGDWGGKLYLVDQKTGHARELLSRPVYFKNLTRKDKDVSKSERERINQEEHEVYADPEFDPIGSLLVFAVHDAGPGEWDAVDAAGPLAILDLRTSAVHVLNATLLKEQQGPFYSNNPHWSPDGSRIVLSFEAGAAIVDPKGLRLTALDGWFEQTSDDESSAVCWLDNRSLVYGVYGNSGSGKPDSFAVLDLETRHSRPAAEVLGVAPAVLDGASDMEATASLILIRREDGVRLYERRTGRLLSFLPIGDKAAVLAGP